jgi:hypothetical protein
MTKLVSLIMCVLCVLVLSGCSQMTATSPLNGENLDGWHVKGDAVKSKWAVGKPEISPDDPKLLISKPGGDAMINLAAHHNDSLDIFSDAKYGDSHIELEVMVPQGSNSGIYVMGEYEIQVLDSFGKEEMGNGDMGAVYGASPPPFNATTAPGTWQTYEIDFKAPRFDENGKKTANAVLLLVKLNGKILHENLVLKGHTPGGVTGKEAAVGPIMFQGNHGPVAYRNIMITPLKE